MNPLNDLVTYRVLWTECGTIEFVGTTVTACASLLHHDEGVFLQIEAGDKIATIRIVETSVRLLDINDSVYLQLSLSDIEFRDDGHITRFCLKLEACSPALGCTKLIEQCVST